MQKRETEKHAMVTSLINAEYDPLVYFVDHHLDVTGS